jgi:hypothetical protein
VGKVTSIDSPGGKSPEMLPASSDRSRSPALRWERAREAFDLRIEGHSPSEIAAILSVTPEAVLDMLSDLYGFEASYLTEQERKTALATEVLRLDKLQTAVWPSAMMGDPKSVDSAVKIIMARAKITGLEQTDPVVQKNLVLVMGEKEEDYIAALRSAGGVTEPG